MVYKRVRANSSSWNPPSKKEASKGKFKQSSFGIQPKVDANSTPPKEIPTYSQDAHDRIMAKILRGLQVKSGDLALTEVQQSQLELEMKPGEVSNEAVEIQHQRESGESGDDNSNSTNGGIQRFSAESKSELHGQEVEEEKVIKPQADGKSSQVFPSLPEYAADPQQDSTLQQPGEKATKGETQGLLPQNKQQLVAGVPNTKIVPIVETSGKADLYEIKVPFVQDSGIGVVLPSDDQIYKLTLIQIFKFTENEATSLMSQSQVNLGITVVSPIMHQRTLVTIKPKYYDYYTNLVRHLRKQPQAADTQSQNNEKIRQAAQRKSYIDSVNYLSNNHKRQLQGLFNQLDADHKNLVLSKIQEQLQLLGGSKLSRF